MVTGAFEEMAPPLCDGSQPPSPRTGPRFYVTSVSGFGGNGGNDSHPITSWQVIDSALAFALVYEAQNERTATRIAAKLNADLDKGASYLRSWIRNLHYNREYRARKRAAKP